MALVVGIGVSTAESTPFFPTPGPLSFRVIYNGEDPLYDPVTDALCESLTVGFVGGIAELPALAQGPIDDLSAGPSGDKSSAAASQAALGAALVLGAILMAAGAWYAGRRWFV